MNKSKIAIGVLIAVGAAWCGGAWFTGKTAETEYKKQIEKANQQLHSFGLKVEFKNKQFERGLFSSQVEDEIVIGDAQNGEQRIVPLSTKIYHGPLPLNQVMKFNLAPVMYAAEGFIAKNTTTEPLFKVFKSDKPIQYAASTSYTLKTASQIDIAEGEIADPELLQNKIAWSNIRLNLDANKDDTGTYSLATKALHINLMNKDDEETDVNFETHWQDVVINGDFKPTQWSYITTGNSESKVASFEMISTDEQGEKYSIIEKGVKSTSALSLNGDFLDAKGTTTIDSLSLKGLNLGQVSYGVELNHLNAESINQLVESFILMLKQPDQDIEPILDSWVQEYGMKIFNNQPQLKITSLQLADEKGKLASDLNIILAKNPSFDFMGKNGLYKQFSDFSANIELNKATLENLFGKIAKLAPEYQEYERDTKALVQEFIENATKGGMMVDSPEALTMKLALENGELKLNGKTVLEEQVQMLLFMWLLGSQMEY